MTGCLCKPVASQTHGCLARARPLGRSRTGHGSHVRAGGRGWTRRWPLNSKERSLPRVCLEDAPMAWQHVCKTLTGQVRVPSSLHSVCAHVSSRARHGPARSRLVGSRPPASRDTRGGRGFKAWFHVVGRCFRRKWLCRGNIQCVDWGLRAGEDVCAVTCDMLRVCGSHRWCRVCLALSASQSLTCGASTHMQSPARGLQSALDFCARGF